MAGRTRVEARGPWWTRRLGLLAMASAFLVRAGAACGGTTGREGLTPTPEPVDATVSLDAGADAEPPLPDAGSFDVTILYADQELPDVSAPVEAGMMTGPMAPNCPPDFPARGSNIITDPDFYGSASTEVPAEYGADGAAIPAPDGSACATYPWLGSLGIDECVASRIGTGDMPVPALPPCNWCMDAGVATVGPGSGAQRSDLCMALFSCVLRTGCGDDGNVVSCLCGSQKGADCTKPTGPCANEELAALQTPPGTPYGTFLMSFTNPVTGLTDICGTGVNAFFIAAGGAVSSKPTSCFLTDGGGD